VVSLSSSHSVNPEFILTPPEDDIDLVVASYARDGSLNWKSIAEAKSRGVPVDQLMSHGIEFNFHAETQPCYKGKYIKTEPGSETLCNVIKFKAACIDDVVENVRNCKTTKPVWLDVTSSSKTSIQYEFTGCVGNRLLKKFT